MRMRMRLAALSESRLEYGPKRAVLIGIEILLVFLLPAGKLRVSPFRPALPLLDDLWVVGQMNYGN